ncbi:MAG: xanthine dehydrogenase family protein molybdopterin-binding subunit [Dehalococcoidia bacterium]
MTEYSVIGKPVPRVDGVVKVAGQATYADDLVAPGMLYGKILRSPYAHAKILNIDTSRAERLPGVRAVCRGEDFPGIRFGFLPSTRDQVPLPVDKVRYYGEGVVGVAAIDPDIAEEAIDLIRVEYEELPAAFTIEEAEAPGAPVIHERAPGNVAASTNFSFGDVEKGFAESDHIREEVIRSQRVVQGFIEPHSILASVDATGRVLIQASKQSPYITWRHFCRAMGLPLSQVRMINYYIGGGFSGKQDPYDLDFAAVKLAMKTGRPVKITLSQDEVLAAQRQRHSKRARIKLGVKKDGTLMACDCTLHSEGGAFAGVGALNIDIFGRCLLEPYHLLNIRYEGYRMYTNRPICGAVRGQAQVIGRYVFENILSMVADDIGMDQYEIRLKNLIKDGDRCANGQRVFGTKFVEAFEKVVEGIGWKEHKAKRPPNRGIGFGAVASSTGSSRFSGHTSSAAVVKITEDGTATVVHGGTEIGQGIDTVVAQVAAEVLGLPMEDIRIGVEDTDDTILEAGMYASRGTVWGGGAVKAAADDARRQLAEVAAEMLEVAPEKLVFQGGRIFVEGNPDRGYSMLDVVRHADYDLGKPIYGRGSWTAPRIDFPDFEGTGLGVHPFAYALVFQAVEVEVDPETGKVKVVNSVTADELGQPINSQMLSAGLEGGTICEMGQALYEGVEVDEKGRTLNPDFHEYRMPTHMDAPPQEVYHVISPSEYTVFGAKGGGEISTASALGAVVNAVGDAVGHHFTELPITPQKIVKALKEKGKGGK